MTKSSTTDKTESWAFNKPETTYLGQTAASIAADHELAAFFDSMGFEPAARLVLETKILPA